MKGMNKRMISTALMDTLKVLNTTIGGLGYSVYNELPPDNTSYPFVTLDIENSNNDGAATEIMRVNLDGWDHMMETNDSTLRLEQMMSNIVKALEQSLYINSDDNLSIRFILEQRKYIKDPDMTIRRRRATLQVRLIGKE